MSANRVFFPQQALDQWLEQGKVSLVDTELTITPAGRRFVLSGAVHFVAEVSGSGDPHALVGKVKSLEQLEALHGEHCADSVIVGESAYQVVEGFLGEPVPASANARKAAARAAALEAHDPLARLLEPE